MNTDYQKLHPLALFVYEKYKDTLEYLHQDVSYPMSRSELLQRLKHNGNDIGFSYRIIKKLIEYNFLQRDSDDIINLTQSYKIIQNFYSDEEFALDNYISLLLYPVTLVELDDIKEYIGTEKHPIKLSLKQLQEIKNLAYAIKLLEDNKVTTKNYGQKVQAYESLKSKALNLFGMEFPENMPYENPANLYVKIDIILYNARFTFEQRKDFYCGYLKRKLPDQQHISVEMLKKLQIQYDALPFKDRYLIAHLYDGNNNISSIICEEAISFLKQLEVSSTIEIFKEFIQNNIDMIDERNQIIHKHLFKDIEDERLKKKELTRQHFSKKLMNLRNIQKELSLI